MFKVSNFILILLSLFFVSISFADEPSAQDLWQQATADTRASAAAIQSQAIANQANQQTYQNQQQQQIMQSLTTIQLQQKAMMHNSQHFPTGSNTFQAQPSKVTGGNNPWSKPNPWQNTVQNPYAGQQYSPSPSSSSPTSTSTNSSNTIYVSPNNSGQQQTQQLQKQNSNPINIYK